MDQQFNNSIFGQITFLILTSIVIPIAIYDIHKKGFKEHFKQLPLEGKFAEICLVGIFCLVIKGR